MKLAVLYVVVVGAVLFWWFEALSPSAGFDLASFRTHAPQHKYTTRRMLRLKMCAIMVALRAGLCVRVVPE